MDMSINVMVEAFTLFHEFEIYVSPEDLGRIESLRYNFDRMIEHVRDSEPIHSIYH